jgi:general stress protein 26
VVADQAVRERFLRGRFIATLATEEADGSSYLTAIWYRFDDGTFFFPTPRTSRKARNVAARGRAAVMVDSRRDGDFAGLGAAGSADLVTGEEALRLNEAVHERYLTPAGLRDPELRAIAVGDDATIRLRPARWHTWDMTVAFGNRLGAPRLAHPLDG